ncbi:AraC family transcriptional regulator [Acinetobacter sichuanensis]|uniref:AraC family transcriptional regulator n=1 Tax=Acinetobacter sichuanensis TaxID=2136183 RepID=A0A371YVU9_9GAMM|nr:MULTISPECIES: AraC family transcriptional regulator [Acinetobacter]MDM1246582.1 AraC family transcriptional regulator [Acinetobacter sp. R933-2]MDQ9022181.1 AraC family transcriptional regulator [Acinetobacter sichuanensis]RFC85601.1 AraC family transcriptional regulator [Acinetobacter sichuanensis]
MVPLVHSTVLKNYVGVMQQLELNAYHLLSNVGLNQNQLSDSKQRIPVEKAIDLLEQSARLSGCDVFGLYMAEQRELSDFGELSLLLSYQHNLRDALNTINRYRNLLNNSLALYIEEVGNTVIIREEIVTMNSGYSRQSIELALGITHRLCAALLANKWRPLSIHFTHNAPQDLSVHRRIFGCTLEFGSEFNGIVCTTHDLDTANPQANLAMANHAQRYLDILPNNGESSIIFDIRKSIYLLLPMGRATIEQVAITHGVNVRTLQRRLEAVQTSFSDLVNDVRRNLVFRYLKNSNYSLGQVSDILGYSMPSSFTRWFISQFGMAPMTWRNINKAILE